jgi:hypothetical protein
MLYAGLSCEMLCVRVRVCVCVWVCGCVGVWVCGCVGGCVGGSSTMCKHALGTTGTRPLVLVVL